MHEQVQLRDRLLPLDSFGCLVFLSGVAIATTVPEAEMKR